MAHQDLDGEVLKGRDERKIHGVAGTLRTASANARDM